MNILTHFHIKIIKLHRRYPGKQYPPSRMTFRAPGAIAPPHVTVVGTHLFETPPRVRATYEEGNKVWAPTLTLTFLPWLNTIILAGDHTSRDIPPKVSSWSLMYHCTNPKSSPALRIDYPEFWVRWKRNPPSL